MRKFLICLFIIILAFVSVFIVLNINSESKIDNIELSKIVEDETEENQIVNDLIVDENVENESIEENKNIVENIEVSNSNNNQSIEIKNTKKVETISNVKQVEEKETTSQPVKEKVANTEQQENTKVTNQDNIPIQQKETPVQKEEKPKCTATSHGVGAGNSNKWFNSETEVVAYYNNLINTLSEKVHNNEITFEEYNKQCPYGYETWSCPYCGKWTLNCY